MYWSISGLIPLGTMILFPQVMSPDSKDSISLCAPKLMKICQQVFLVTRESCANVIFESCELLILCCTLPQSVQFVGKATLRFCTHKNLCGDHISCYDWQFDVVLWIHGGHMTKCICNWNVCSLFVHNFERQIREGSDYESLHHWTNVNHVSCRYSQVASGQFLM